MDGSDGQSVLLRREGAVAVVTLNEPASLNALSAGIKAGVEAHIPALVADPESRHRFVREARSAAATTHAAIAQIYDVDEPAGTIDLVFSGGAAIRLEVECIEARLADLGGAWEAGSRPEHAD